MWLDSEQLNEWKVRGKRRQKKSGHNIKKYQRARLTKSMIRIRHIKRQNLNNQTT